MRCGNERRDTTAAGAPRDKACTRRVSIVSPMCVQDTAPSSSSQLEGERMREREKELARTSEREREREKRGGEGEFQVSNLRAKSKGL